MFQIGDYVVKPATGVCRVENILHLDLSKADKDVYKRQTLRWLMN